MVQMLTQKSVEPLVKKSLLSIVVLIEVILPAWAISPIELLGLLSRGSLMIPITFYFVE